MQTTKEAVIVATVHTHTHTNSFLKNKNNNKGNIMLLCGFIDTG